MLNKREREERARSIRKRIKAYMDNPRNMTPDGVHRDLMAAYMELGNLLHLESDPVLQSGMRAQDRPGWDEAVRQAQGGDGR